MSLEAREKIDKKDTLKSNENEISKVMSLTSDKNHPDLGRGIDKDEVGQNKVYLVLSEEEKAKGFIRPVRTSYIHVGEKLEGTIEDIDLEKYKEQGWVKFLRYPEGGKGCAIGKYLTLREYTLYQKNGTNGCGVLTIMHRSIAETYARDPKFYGATYCMGCYKHLDVAEFIWEGTNETVGS